MVLFKSGTPSLEDQISALPSDQPSYQGYVLASTQHPEPLEIAPEKLSAAKQVADADGTIVLREVYCQAKASQEYDVAFSAEFTLRYCTFKTLSEDAEVAPTDTETPKARPVG